MKGETENLFDKMTISREIDGSDLQEYLRPIDVPGVDLEKSVAANYPNIVNMRSEEMFDMIIKIEYVFYQNMEKTRADIVV